tara:strand:+ start:15642 stop:16493 length:852 start_codon:yes stop_codon:yes gene_type:complete
MPTLAQYSRHLARLIPTVGSREFPEQLIQLLRALVPFDDATIVLYPGTELPVIEYFEVPASTGSSSLDRFVKGAFLLDPYYLAATRDKKFGVFRLRDLAPSGFRESEYYRSWYRNCGYQDECGYLLAIGKHGFVNIALGKTRARTRFSQQQLGRLAAVLPTIEVLCHQQWQDAAKAGTKANLRAQLNSALDAFGSSLLTEREAQVINLVLHGHSTKTLAERLSISVETVKLHRKHAYAKLEVSSQAELFYLFLDSVMSATDYDGGDTLIAYLRPPETAQRSSA